MSTTKKPRKRLRVTEKVRTLVYEAMRSARLDTCAVEPEHKAAMKLYLDSWVVARLELALSIMNGEESGQ